MATQIQHSELKVSVSGAVATVEICRPPHNYFDNRLIAQIGEAFEALDADPQCRAIVLAAEGKSFCAGANFSSPENQAVAVKGTKEKHLYKEAIRLFRVRRPVVAADHGPAVGGGLGLAMVAAFRVSCSEARFSANFCKLGFHPGFGLTTTLPRVVGNQMAALMFYTGRRIGGDEAKRIGLVGGLRRRDQGDGRAQASAIQRTMNTRMQTQDDSLPLAGITIVDLTRVLAGPYCTRLLADMGARVIKVERTGTGDETRAVMHQLEPGRSDQSTYFTRVNAGKESVALDLASADGRQVVLDLARHADVFIENFAPGVVARLGCDYAAIQAVKPDIVYCSISGFGQTGPWRHRPAFAHTINAISGLMYLEQGDEASPRASNLQAADVLAAVHAAAAIVGALFRRYRTKRGAYVDISMLEALIAADSITFPSVLNGGKEHGNPRPGMLVDRKSTRL